MILGDIHFLWKPLLEILILWFVIYRIILFLISTRAIKVLLGILFLLIIFIISEKLGLAVLEWLMTKLFAISVIATLIIFQPEIRQGLAKLGERRFFSTTLKEEELDYVLKEIGRAAEMLSRDKIGALIAIEKDEPLSSYIETGVVLDARVSADLIQTIFTPNNPLHDGGIVIQRGRIMGAGCLFPITQNQDLSRIFGTRHRAALGLSQETDSIIIIVSEERQDISLVYRGRLYKDLSREEVESKVKEFMNVKKEA